MALAKLTVSCSVGMQFNNSHSTSNLSISFNFRHKVLFTYYVCIKLQLHVCSVYVRTHSSSVVTLAPPSTSSSLQITDRFLDMYQPVEFLPSTSFCSLSSWFTLFCIHHLITIPTFALSPT